MSSHCEHCHKGLSYGHMVSHAKNRLARTFRPNLQKTKAMIDGIRRSAVLCAKCIKRLKRDGRIGRFALIRKEEKKVFETLPKMKKKVSEKEEAKEKMKLESIVGKA